jgi:hypothetical protein
MTPLLWIRGLMKNITLRFDEVFDMKIITCGVRTNKADASVFILSFTKIDIGLFDPNTTLFYNALTK